MRRFLFLLSLSLALAWGMTFAVSENGAAKRVKIVLVGDSTVTDNAGWGLGFAQFVSEDVELINTARGGRSSMSFRKEGRWERALALKGDYYLIQFGHNDEPGKPGRSTTLEEYRGYMENYVDEARALGATPVLVTPLVRRQFRDPEQPHKITSSLITHAEIVRDIARRKDVPVIELHDRSRELCEKLGMEGCYVFSPRKEGGYDATHLNAEGYVLFGQLVAEDLARVVPKLRPLLLKAPRNPHPLPPELQYAAVVAFDGSGTHTTVQAAIDAAPSGATRPHRILIKPGTYRESVVVPETKPFIYLLGEAGEGNRTVLSGGTPAGKGDPEQGLLAPKDNTPLVIHGADFLADNLTFENKASQDERSATPAAYVTADRARFFRCRFSGGKEVLRTGASVSGSTRQYFKECEIAGQGDLISGSSTAIFDRCQLNARGDGALTAASTPASQEFGYVFFDCRLTAGRGVERGTYLGRVAGPHAATAFIRCELDARVRSAGWHNWENPDNEKTARYAEYGNTGPGATVDGRVSWARQLSSEEAARYTLANVLGGDDRWDPTQ